MPNENNLEGIKCPDCGQEDRFIIAANVKVEVTDDGADIASPFYGTGFEWDDDSYTRCPECDREGTLKDFSQDRVQAVPVPEPEPERKADGTAYIIVPYENAIDPDAAAKPGKTEDAAFFRVFVLTRSTLNEAGDFDTFAEAQDQVRLISGGTAEGRLFESESFYDLPGFGRWPDVRAIRDTLPPLPSPSLTAAILDNPKSFLPDSGPGTDHDHGPDRGR